MAELKTKKTTASVSKFLDAIEDDTQRADAKALAKLFTKATGEKPALWGTAIVGYGDQTVVYETGRTFEWMKVAFSPRKANLVLYLRPGIDRHLKLLTKLGKHKVGKGCLYVKKLSDVDLDVLEALIKADLARSRKIPLPDDVAALPTKKPVKSAGSAAQPKARTRPKKR